MNHGGITVESRWNHSGEKERKEGVCKAALLRLYLKLSAARQQDQAGPHWTMPMYCTHVFKHVQDWRRKVLKNPSILNMFAIIKKCLKQWKTVNKLN